MPGIHFKGFYKAILLRLLYINPPETQVRGFTPIGMME